MSTRVKCDRRIKTKLGSKHGQSPCSNFARLRAYELRLALRCEALLRYGVYAELNLVELAKRARRGEK